MYPYSFFSKIQEAEIVIAIKVRRIGFFFKFDGSHYTISILASGNHWWVCVDQEHRYKRFRPMCMSSPCVGLLQMTISTDSTQIQHCSVMDVQTHVAIKILVVFMSQETDLKYPML